MRVFDTNFLVRFLKGDQAAKKKLERYDEPITTTAVNAFELLYGYHMIKDKDKDSKAIENAKGLLNSISTLPFDLEASAIASRVAADLTSEGRMLEHMDVLIASIALKHNATLVTRNIKHFPRIPKLKVEEW